MKPIMLGAGYTLGIGATLGVRIEGTETLKRNSLFREFFRQRGFFDLDPISREAYQSGALEGKELTALRIWIDANVPFTRRRDADATEQMTVGGGINLRALHDFSKERFMKPVLAVLVCCLALSWSVACRSNDAPPFSRARADIVLKPDTELIRAVVPRNTTLERLLQDHGLTMEAVHQVIAAARAVFDPRRLRATQPFVLERTLGGDIRHFEYDIDADTYLRVSRPSLSDELRASVVPIPKQRHEVTVAGSISDTTPSLFQAMEAASEQPELTIAMAEIFAGEIDFNTEVQPGDRFGLAFERFTREGRPASYGAIMAAAFQNDGRVVRAIRFTPPGGEPAYYDDHGRSLRRFFLRSPLKFEPRITSGFTRRRFHPVLKVHRPHLGVDYGAPTGAPVVAVASGTVVSATFDRRNGRMVRLRHARGYETYYLHLSAFGPGVRAGRRVSQGQVIGRVGATGLATGPHLDYRLRKNGAFVNPLREHRNMPPGDPVPATARAAFETALDRALEMLNQAMQAGASDGEASPTISSVVTAGDETATVREAL